MLSLRRLTYSLVTCAEIPWMSCSSKGLGRISAACHRFVIRTVKGKDARTIHSTKRVLSDTPHLFHIMGFDDPYSKAWLENNALCEHVSCRIQRGMDLHCNLGTMSSACLLRNGHLAFPVPKPRVIRNTHRELVVLRILENPQAVTTSASICRC